MFAVAYAWSAPTEAKMHEKGKAETRDLNPPIGRTGGIPPRKFLYLCLLKRLEIHVKLSRTMKFIIWIYSELLSA